MYYARLVRFFTFFTNWIYHECFGKKEPLDIKKILMLFIASIVMFECVFCETGTTNINSAEAAASN